MIENIGQILLLEISFKHFCHQENREVRAVFLDFPIPQSADARKSVLVTKWSQEFDNLDYPVWEVPMLKREARQR